MKIERTIAPGPGGADTWHINRRPKWMSILLGVGLAASIVLAACAPPGRTDTAPFPTISARPNAAALPPATRSNSNNLATDFPITVYQGQKVLGGQQIDLANLLSQGKPVVLNFWAGLCPPCRLEMPDLQAAYDEYQDGVLLFGLDVGVFTGLGSQEDGRALLQELEITYPAGTTSDAGVVREYQVIGMPTTYFITPDGHIVQKWTGLLTRDKLVELIGELLEASESS